MWNDPVGSAETAGGWVKDTAVGAWHGVEHGYHEHGVAGALGAAAGLGLEAVNPLKKLKMLERAAEAAEELGDFNGREYYGIIPGNIPGTAPPNAIWFTLDDQATNSLPESLIVVASSGYGSL